MNDGGVARTVGFIGLGNMGAAMAERMSAAFNVVGYDIQPAARDRCAGAGISVADGVDELIRSASIIILSLPRPEISVEVVQEICSSALPADVVLVETSTCGVGVAQQCAELASQRGCGYVDGPVSGGPTRARLGSLSVMSAGRPQDLDRVRPALSHLGKLFELGDQPGIGQSVKLANNAIASTTLAVTCEAVAVAAKTGVSMAQMVEVLNASSGRSEASDFKFPKFIVPGTFDLGSPGETTLKDVRMYLDAAKLYGMADSIGHRAADLWSRFVAANPGADVTRIYEFVESELW